MEDFFIAGIFVSKNNIINDSKVSKKRFLNDYKQYYKMLKTESKIQSQMNPIPKSYK